MEVSIGDIAATAALVLSIYTVWRQHGYSEQTKALNELLINKEVSETVSANKGDLFANFVNTGKNRYEFKIYNGGKGVAKNVRCEVLGGKELFADHDLQTKFPYPTLERHQSISLNTRVHLQSPRRASVKLIWDDDAGGGEKVITDDVY